MTPDHVNPEAAWPELGQLARETREAGRELVERLAIVPAHARAAARWVDAGLRPRVERLRDTQGYAREDDWHAGALVPPPAAAAGWFQSARRASPRVAQALAAARDGVRLDEPRSSRCSVPVGTTLRPCLAQPTSLRQAVAGDGVSYVVNRNINYTNICTYRCGFCAFSKGRSAQSLRGPAYLLSLEEIGARTREAWERGATEVCLQGGIHPSFTGETYLDIVTAVKRAAPRIHVHAFSPLEVTHGARTLGLSLEAFLQRLRTQGLATLPGTAAEILDDEVRAVLCPDKLVTAEWLEVMADCAPRRSPERRRRSCSATSTAMSTGPATCCVSATCRRSPADSPSSSRCHSCTWRHRSGEGALHARGPCSARRCSCMP